MELKDYIRDIPDFPKEGIVYKDITPLLKDNSALKKAVEKMASPWKNKGIDYVAGAESRGFIFGSAIAMELAAGFIPVRKPGKLPHKVVSESYELEYGKDSLEMHIDAIEKGSRVLIVDDLLATGGTAAAMVRMIEKNNATVSGFSFLIELGFLQGRKKLSGKEIKSEIIY
ncbi:MAG: adenine phosphoribosyltransferase [Candidatus Muiribacteriota bacterium]